MKTKYLLLLLFFCTCAFSQTMTEKYNSILNRYEYFDGQGNLTGYKVYDSLFKEWKYYEVEVQSYERKPIQYAKPQTDDNFALLQQVANQKQNSYNSNHKRIDDYLSKVQINIFEIENLEIRAKTQKRYDSEIVYVLNNKGYDLSNNALTQQVLDFIFNKINEIKDDEFKKYNDEIENRNKLIETKINTSVGENAFPYNLEKYLGDHTVYKIEDYTRASDGKWTIANIEKSIAGVFLFKDQIHFKRNNSQLVGVRVFSYIKFSNGFYIFSSNNGETYIDKDFKKIIFFDMNDVNKKHIYYVM